MLVVRWRAEVHQLPPTIARPDLGHPTPGFGWWERPHPAGADQMEAIMPTKRTDTPEIRQEPNTEEPRVERHENGRHSPSP